MAPLERAGAATLLRIAGWASALLVAFGVSFLVPPMESPDEDAHIGRAYLISKGRWLLQPVPDEPALLAPGGDVAGQLDRARLLGGRAGGMVDAALTRFAEINLTLAHDAGRRLTAAEEAELRDLRWGGGERYVFMAGTGYYLPAIYLPQALGLLTGRVLHFGVARSYQLARACTLLACVALLAVAFRMVAPNPLVVAILLLPMNVFQLVSPTLDGLAAALALLTVAFFAKALAAEPDRYRPYAWGLAGCLLLLVGSRAHLLPLLALPFYVSWRRRSRGDFYVGCLIAIAAIGWTLFVLQTSSDPRLVRTHGTAELLQYYLAHPLAYLRVVAASLSYSEMIEFYQQSFIGILGWLDARLPAYAYPTLSSGLALCALASVCVSTLRRDWPVRVLLAALALASAAFIFLALLVTWTPHPATVVYGVQGRYFVIPALLLAFALSGFACTASAPARWMGRGLLAVFASVSLYALTGTLLTRFH